MVMCFLYCKEIHKPELLRHYFNWTWKDLQKNKKSNMTNDVTSLLYFYLSTNDSQEL